ncbi:hypothetical protein KOM00_04050 [Geomonas sp. Red69]|uniref:hypothetical protein n=1 Tax=Geomonas diazotrophica TaxID=2843197 RepID=UPI001C10F04E|nr:hypothetical protein [Geomonas diazotrophica]MBU5635898.1 hypothetical protein [Geomonas diazotrophica]
MKDQVLSISTVRWFEDTRPILRHVTWGEFVDFCRVPVIRGALPLDIYLTAEKSVKDRQKDGTAIVAGRFRRSGTRRQSDLEALSMVTLDLDDGHYYFDGLCEALEGFEAVIFTSYSNSAERPKLRAYLPLAGDLTCDIKATLGRIIDYFDERVGHLDSASRRPGQLFYSPACPPGGEKLYRVRHSTGVTLDPADFFTPSMNDAPKMLESTVSKRPALSRKPGDVYNARASWADLLEPLGWSPFFRNHWTRPGKQRGISGSVLAAGFYVHSSAPETAPFQCGKCYSPFGAYALIHHSGDHSAAAKELRRLAVAS